MDRYAASRVVVRDGTAEVSVENGTDEFAVRLSVTAIQDAITTRIASDANSEWIRIPQFYCVECRRWRSNDELSYRVDVKSSLIQPAGCCVNCEQRLECERDTKQMS